MHCCPYGRRSWLVDHKQEHLTPPPPLARVMGVGRQQQQHDEEGDGECVEDGDIKCKRGGNGWAGEDSVDCEDTFSVYLSDQMACHQSQLIILAAMV